MSPRPALRAPPILSAARGLELICDGLLRAILRELAIHGPLTRQALIARLHAGSTRVFESLRKLREAGLLTVSDGGRAARHAITGSGRALHQTAALIEAWAARHPGGPPESSVGWRAFEDLGAAWREGLLEWIVRLAPTETDVEVGLPGLEGRRLGERLALMEEARMIERRRGRAGPERLRLTPWAARAIGPLAAIGRWEARFEPPGGAALAVEDALAGMLATLPLVRLGPEVEATVALTVEGVSGSPAGQIAGVWVRLAAGRPVGLGEGAAPRPADAWAGGSVEEWLAAVLDGRTRALRSGGREPGGARLAAGLVDELHGRLVGEVRTRSYPE